MENFPEDIINHILLMLPVKSTFRFRCVCKDWHELFRNPKFIKMHRHHAIQNSNFSVLLKLSHDSGYVNYTIEDFDVRSSSYLMPVKTNLPPDTYDYGDSFVGDCLIGIPLDYGKKICLWNPSTREYKYIPTLNPNQSYNRNSLSKYGICYDRKIDDYKLFKIVVWDRDVDISSEIWVRRLGSDRFGSDSWKSIGIIPYNIQLIKVSTKPLNGIIHWIGDTEVIVSFDIVERRSSEIQIPSCYLNNINYPPEYMEVGVLGEYLYLLVDSVWPMQGNMNLWVMKEYGVTNSWTKIFSLSKCTENFASLRPLHYLNKNGEILLQGARLSSEEDALVTYNPRSRRLLTLDIPCMPKHFNANSVVGSLVSLNSGQFQKAAEISRVDTRDGAESGEFLEASEIFKVETRDGADSGELVKAENISMVDTRHGDYKYYSLAVEPGYIELQRSGWGTFVFCFAVLCFFAAICLYPSA